MIARSGNFNRKFFAASFLFVFSFISLFLRIFWSHGSFTVKESSCPEKCCSLERKALEKLYYRLPACCPRKRNHEHAQPRNLKNFYYGNVKKKGGF